MKKTLRKILSGVMAGIIAGSLSASVFAYNLTDDDPFYSVVANPSYSMANGDLAHCLNPENIVWQNGDSSIKGYANGKLFDSELLNLNVVVVAPEEAEVTNEYLGLSENYKIIDIDEANYVDNALVEKNISLEGRKSYFISDSDNNIINDDEVYKILKESMVEEKVDAVFRSEVTRFEFRALTSLVINLKTPDENFSPDKYEGLEGLEFVKMDEVGQKYAVRIDSVYVGDMDSILENVNNDENTDSTIVNTKTNGLGIAEAASTLNFVRIDGDSNSDNRLNIRDAAFIARKLVERNNEELPEYADYNLDGEINIRDAAGIARFLVEKNEK